MAFAPGAERQDPLPDLGAGEGTPVFQKKRVADGLGEVGESEHEGFAVEPQRSVAGDPFPENFLLPFT